MIIICQCCGFPKLAWHCAWQESTLEPESTLPGSKYGGPLICVIRALLSRGCLCSRGVRGLHLQPWTSKTLLPSINKPGKLLSSRCEFSAIDSGYCAKPQIPVNRRRDNWPWRSHNSRAVSQQAGSRRKKLVSHTGPWWMYNGPESLAWA